VNFSVIRHVMSFQVLPLLISGRKICSSGTSPNQTASFLTGVEHFLNITYMNLVMWKSSAISLCDLPSNQILNWNDFCHCLFLLGISILDIDVTPILLLFLPYKN
jgi:hypothetical protein